MQFVLIGDGPLKDSLISSATQRGLRNVSFLPVQPADEIPSLIASADILLVPLKMDIPGAVPSKLYEAMASQKPVILVAYGEAAEIVQRHKAGIVVSPGNVRELVQAIQALRDPYLRQEMGINGRRAAEERYDRARIARRFIDYLEGRL